MSDATLRILLVEDAPEDVVLLRWALSKAGAGASFDVRNVPDLAAATAELERRPFDLVLLDLTLPDSVGLATVAQVLEATDIPVVVLTGYDDAELSRRAVQMGAQDYLVKGEIDGKALARIFHTAVVRCRRETRALRKAVREVDAAGMPRMRAARGPDGSGSANANPYENDEIPFAEIDATRPAAGPLRTNSGTLPIGAQLGNYRITAVLGRGGMGTVYEAANVMLDRRAAIKILPASSDEVTIERFLREARAAARLNHPNVVGVYDVGNADGRRYIAMELVRGGSAEEFLESRGAFNWPEATRVTAEACRGLEAAHQAGIIHRDIKPGNILRSDRGEVKLADFGLAKDVVKAGDSLGGSGRIVGTPPFMSPEQGRGWPVDVRSDIYSLGATYFTLLTGCLPFQPLRSAAEMIAAHWNEPVPDPREVIPQLPPRCAEIVARAMAKEPSARHPSAFALLADLESLLPRPDAPAVRSGLSAGERP